MFRPNVILITVECWRGDHFGVLTPNLARLGGESAVFSAAYTTGGWTLAAMTAMMSSAYPSMFGGLEPALATPERQVLAECLMRSGYWTAGFSTNPCCGSTHGFHRGFGTFRDERRTPMPVPGEQPGEKRDFYRMAEIGMQPRDVDTMCDAAHLTDLGLQWIEKRRPEQPFFLWLHYWDPHWPCFSRERPMDRQQLQDAWHDRHVFVSEVIPRHGRYDPGEEMSSRWIGRYREAVSAADREIGRLLDTLRLRPDWDRTVVAVTGDHGEEFYEHGTWHHAWNQLHKEGVHVPFIMRVPGAPPRTLDQPVSHLDIAPTLLDYAQARQDAAAGAMMGTSLRPLIEGGGLPHRPIYTESLSQPDGSSYRLAILDGEWKYIYDFDDPHDSQLFRLPDDPGERHNLRDSEPAIFRRFEMMRLEQVSRGLTGLMQRGSLGQKDFEMDEMMREQMVALGYIAG